MSHERGSVAEVKIHTAVEDFTESRISRPRHLKP